MSLENVKNELAETNQSVWTIDLAYLFRAHGVRAVFTTITFGAKEEYGHEEFYSATFKSDSRRVNALFAGLSDTGIPAFHCDIPISALKRLCAPFRPRKRSRFRDMLCGPQAGLATVVCPKRERKEEAVGPGACVPPPLSLSRPSGRGEGAESGRGCDRVRVRGRGSSGGSGTDCDSRSGGSSGGEGRTEGGRGRGRNGAIAAQHHSVPRTTRGTGGDSVAASAYAEAALGGPAAVARTPEGAPSGAEAALALCDREDRGLTGSERREPEFAAPALAQKARACGADLASVLSRHQTRHGRRAARRALNALPSGVHALLVLVDAETLLRTAQRAHGHNFGGVHGYGGAVMTAVADEDPATPFCGHFILVTAYDRTSDEFLYMDPSSSEARHRVSSRDLDRARRREGTDQDLLIVDMRPETVGAGRPSV